MWSAATPGLMDIAAAAARAPEAGGDWWAPYSEYSGATPEGVVDVITSEDNAIFNRMLAMAAMAPGPLEQQATVRAELYAMLVAVRSGAAFEEARLERLAPGIAWAHVTALLLTDIVNGDQPSHPGWQPCDASNLDDDQLRTRVEVVVTRTGRRELDEVRAVLAEHGGGAALTASTLLDTLLEHPVWAVSVQGDADTRRHAWLTLSEAYDRAMARVWQGAARHGPVVGARRRLRADGGPRPPAGGGLRVSAGGD